MIKEDLWHLDTELLTYALVKHDVFIIYIYQDIVYFFHYKYKSCKNVTVIQILFFVKI